MKPNTLSLNLTKEQAVNAIIRINIDDDPIIAVVFQREEDGSLYLCGYEEANPDSPGIIENHYPEYFDEVTL